MKTTQIKPRSLSLHVDSDYCFVGTMVQNRSEHTPAVGEFENMAVFCFHFLYCVKQCSIEDVAMKNDDVLRCVWVHVHVISVFFFYFNV